jgi:hypothetical protein
MHSLRVPFHLLSIKHQVLRELMRYFRQSWQSRGLTLAMAARPISYRSGAGRFNPEQNTSSSSSFIRD